MEVSARLIEINQMYEVFNNLFKKNSSGSFENMSLRTIDDSLNYLSNIIRLNESIKISNVTKKAVIEFDEKWRMHKGSNISITQIDHEQYSEFYKDSRSIIKRIVLEFQNDEDIDEFMQLEYIDIDF